MSVVASATISSTTSHLEVSNSSDSLFDSLLLLVKEVDLLSKRTGLSLGGKQGLKRAEGFDEV